MPKVAESQKINGVAALAETGAKAIGPVNPVGKRRIRSRQVVRMGWSEWRCWRWLPVLWFIARTFLLLLRQDGAYVLSLLLNLHQSGSSGLGPWDIVLNKDS